MLYLIPRFPRKASLGPAALLLPWCLCWPHDMLGPWDSLCTASGILINHTALPPIWVWVLLQAWVSPALTIWVLVAPPGMGEPYTQSFQTYLEFLLLPWSSSCLKSQIGGLLSHVESGSLAHTLSHISLQSVNSTSLLHSQQGNEAPKKIFSLLSHSFSQARNTGWPGRLIRARAMDTRKPEKKFTINIVKYYPATWFLNCLGTGNSI